MGVVALRAAQASIVLMVLIASGALLGCGGQSGGSAGRTTKPPRTAPATALQVIGAVPFKVKCSGAPFTLLGVPADGHTLLAFVSAEGDVVSPVSFHSDLKVVDQDGLTIFDRADDKPATAAAEAGIQTCSFHLYATDDADNTYFGDGTATAAFGKARP